MINVGASLLLIFLIYGTTNNIIPPWTWIFFTFVIFGWAIPDWTGKNKRLVESKSHYYLEKGRYYIELRQTLELRRRLIKGENL